MTKSDIKAHLKNKIIAVIRSDNAETAEIMSETILNSGIEVVEITFTVDGAADIIHELRKKFPNYFVGAGTVTKPEQAEDALKSGAQFIVSPCVVEDVGDFCKAEDVFCSLGAQTSTEIYKAYLHGGDVVKLFPGELLTPSVMKIFHGPFPYVDFMPTGGISDKNAREWFNNGAFALGVGGYLTGGIDKTNIPLLESRIKKLLESLKE